MSMILVEKLLIVVRLPSQLVKVMLNKNNNNKICQVLAKVILY